MSQYRYEISIRELTDAERLRTATKEVIFEEPTEELAEAGPIEVDPVQAANQRLDELADADLNEIKMQHGKQTNAHEAAVADDNGQANG